MTEILILLSALYVYAAYAVLLVYIESTNGRPSPKVLAWFVCMSVFWPIKIVLYDYFQIDNRDGLKWYEARYEDCKYVWPFSLPVFLITALTITIIGMCLK